MFAGKIPRPMDYHSSWWFIYRFALLVVDFWVLHVSYFKSNILQLLKKAGTTGEKHKREPSGSILRLQTKTKYSNSVFFNHQWGNGLSTEDTTSKSPSSPSVLWGLQPLSDLPSDHRHKEVSSLNLFFSYLSGSTCRTQDALLSSDTSRPFSLRAVWRCGHMSWCVCGYFPDRLQLSLICIQL